MLPAAESLDPIMCCGQELQALGMRLQDFVSVLDFELALFFLLFGIGMFTLCLRMLKISNLCFECTWAHS